MREDDDASGPSILLRAAAEMIVDEAERDSHIDAAEALLGLIPSVDLETSIIHGHWLLFFRAGRATPSATQCFDVIAVGAARNGGVRETSCFDSRQRCTACFYSAELSKFANAS